jgi:hypothetical protein
VRRFTSDSRVPSPSAAKTWALDLRLLEAGLDDAHQRALGGFFQEELDQGRGLAAVVDLGIDGVGMPRIGEVSLGLDLLHHRRPADMVEALDGDLAGGRLPRHEGAVEAHAEPGAELAMVGQRLPDARLRRLQIDGPFDTIAHMQPPGCLFI